MTDKPRFLITTADEKTWKFDRPVLFLGQWCCRYDRRQQWTAMDAVIAEPYGLGDGQKDKDHAYVTKVYEELLAELGDVLNEYHKTNHGLRYWRIVLGHWLNMYTTVIFNRWFTVWQAIDNYDISGSTVLDIGEYSLATSDSLSFLWASNDDLLNHVICSKILKRSANINIESKATSLENLPGFSERNKSSIPQERLFKRMLLKAVGIMQMLSRDTDALIINSYLPIKEEIKLQISLGQLPQLWRTPPLEIVEPDLSLRKSLQLDATGYQGFDQFVRDLLMEIIPTCYLEGYRVLNQQVKALGWPKKPKFIFTCNNFFYNEIFTAWTGPMVEEGVPYYIGQHGADGVANEADIYSTYDAHFIATCDKYITWGWVDEDPKRVPAFIFKTVGRKPPEVNSNMGLLLIENLVPPRVYPWDNYSRFHIYQDEQFRFVEALPAAIHQQLTVRLCNGYKLFDWCDEQRWNDRSPDTKIDNGQSDIWELTSNSRLIVHAYHSTGIFETLFLNIPTICFWNGGLSILRESAKPYYEQFRQAEILFDSPEAAAKKISEVWDDVPAWWNSEEVQSARRNFCDKYTKKTDKPVKAMKNILLSC